MLHKLNSLHVIKDISENSDISLAVLLGNWPFLYFCFSVAFFIEGSNHFLSKEALGNNGSCYFFLIP